mgnify:CR=1 FL=1
MLVLISEDKRFFCFVFEHGLKLAYQSSGDCCAESWIEHVSGLNWLIGNEISDVIEREYQENVAQSDDDHVDIFGYTFVTNKGRFDLEFRGEHNGYYYCFVEYAHVSELPNMSDVLNDF